MGYLRCFLGLSAIKKVSGVSVQVSASLFLTPETRHLTPPSVLKPDTRNLLSGSQVEFLTPETRHLLAVP
ncbi:hypothetical protein D3OALGA1CA_351 [Olavius algarvensis associated proteobacterium Delta 3]|nr:hypothetical protein D3OALGA1CA_351 [Olavius algarvensis associated proteobacterium Delta 3]